MTMKLLGLTRNGAGPTFVWLHGFTQTKESAHVFRSLMASTFEMVTIDLPGHGENVEVSASLPEIADLLVDTVPDQEFILGGYSFGGRVALHVALKYPERVRALVTIGATRGIASLEERRARQENDEQLANEIEVIGIDAFLEKWLAQDMFAHLPADDLERAARSRDARGLAASLRDAGTGTQYWLGDVLGQLTMPYLALAGQYDQKFSSEAVALASGAKHGRYLIIPNAHHAAHLEAPADCVEAILAP